jgi:HAD superfamily hydrolase (TIGR01484 family)
MERMERVQRMIIGVDIDGTLFDGVQVAPDAIRALQRARDEGHLLVVVSGRRWDDLPDVLGDVLELFHVVVGEEGAVIADVSSREVRLLADPIDSRLVAALHEAHVESLAVGRVVVGAPTRFAAEMAAARDRVGSHLRLVTNKASVALVPVGCDKASGLRAAIDLLHADGAPIVAIGDAENDLPMFAMATHAVAVANA